jgi:hypothetical protein
MLEAADEVEEVVEAGVWYEEEEECDAAGRRVVYIG